MINVNIINPLNTYCSSICKLNLISITVCTISGLYINSDLYTQRSSLSSSSPSFRIYKWSHCIFRCVTIIIYFVGFIFILEILSLATIKGILCVWQHTVFSSITNIETVYYNNTAMDRGESKSEKVNFIIITLKLYGDIIWNMRNALLRSFVLSFFFARYEPSNDFSLSLAGFLVTFYPNTLIMYICMYCGGCSVFGVHFSKMVLVFFGFGSLFLSFYCYLSKQNTHSITI